MHAHEKVTSVCVLLTVTVMHGQYTEGDGRKKGEQVRLRKGGESCSDNPGGVPYHISQQ